MRLEFTFIAVRACDMALCLCNYVMITDGDGTILLAKKCGFSSVDPSNYLYGLPPVIMTRSNTVDIYFHTGTTGNPQAGWSLNWTALTPGLISSALIALITVCFKQKVDAL